MLTCRAPTWICRESTYVVSLSAWGRVPHASLCCCSVIAWLRRGKSAFDKSSFTLLCLLKSSSGWTTSGNTARTRIGAFHSSWSPWYCVSSGSQIASGGTISSLVGGWKSSVSSLPGACRSCATFTHGVPFSQISVHRRFAVVARSCCFSFAIQLRLGQSHGGMA